MNQIWRSASYPMQIIFFNRFLEYSPLASLSPLIPNVHRFTPTFTFLILPNTCIINITKDSSRFCPYSRFRVCVAPAKPLCTARKFPHHSSQSTTKAHCYVQKTPEASKRAVIYNGTVAAVAFVVIVRLHIWPLPLTGQNECAWLTTWASPEHLQFFIKSYGCDRGVFTRHISGTGQKRGRTPFWCSLTTVVPLTNSTILMPISVKIERKYCKLCFTTLYKNMFISVNKTKRTNI